MIKVVAKSVLKEGTREKVMEMFEEMINLTRQEEGCISYELFEDINDPNILTFIEEWEDGDKLNAHMNSDHFKRIIPATAQYKIDPGPADVYKKVR